MKNNTELKIDNKDILDCIKDTQEVAIDTTDWEEYKLGNLFEIKGSKTTTKKVLEQKGDGIYPYITTTASNQGVSGYYNFFTENGNVLTFDSAVLGTCFYQEKDFSASDHVELGIPYFKDFNKKIGLYFQIIINKTNEGIYHYGHKANQQRIKDTIIKLPSILNQETKEYEPDWKYMEDYISDLEKELNLLQVKTKIDNVKSTEKKEVDTTEWKEFDFFYIFKEEEAKTGIISPKKEKIKTKENINYISAGTSNNACDGYVNKERYLNNIHSKCLTMGTRGEYNGNIFYQEEEFVNSNTCMLLKYNDLFNITDRNKRKISLFISSVWNTNKIYGSYGIYPTLKSLQNDKIKLPSILNTETNEYEPDWEYMENYIINLEKNLNN